MPLFQHQYFVYRHIMDANLKPRAHTRTSTRLTSTNISPVSDVALSRLAGAIGEPSRARILCCLLDGHARTSTELATVAEVSPSTASVHLNRLKAERLVKLLVQGKHRYYSLEGPDVASALEALMVVAGGSRPQFTPATPVPLRYARTCYDHMAGAVAVSLQSRFVKSGWIIPASQRSGSKPEDALDLTPTGNTAFEALGIDIAATRSLRRRFAYACVDWSERKPHIGGALGAALLQTALQRKWVLRDLDSRALNITRLGQRELSTRFGIQPVLA
jgi:DNA-binding transcriptional ArsR family regulator